jgi:predicted AlkP superfamily phosphohydrolase/phosphomutase
MNGFLLKRFNEILNIDDILGFDAVAKREVYTENRNRIDIFVETSNYCFFIENKIDAGLNNDLNDYLEYTKNIVNNRGKEYFGIVLSRNKKGLNNKIYYLSYNRVV